MTIDESESLNEQLKFKKMVYRSEIISVNHIRFIQYKQGYILYLLINNTNVKCRQRGIHSSQIHLNKKTNH